MSEHVIDPSEPYHPEKLDKKEYVGAAAYFEMDLRTGVILEVEDFPEMRKPSYKIHVDFGPVIGKLWSSAQITNYSRAQLIGRTVVGAVNLGDKTLPTGFVSQFLVLGSLDPDGTVILLELPEGVLPGSMVA
ncbi:MAG: tRNA-binding protein [Candidatus Thermoplasmatota archaeon]|nr:tRNA-binding protein [Candidatus Thermoplasmatota archaeon]|tara:strand:- start:365 stop:760 length:396 start_codon:yes stop_codon:yes gene_type:complete